MNEGSLAAIFVCVYLFIYSFLAIPIYSKHSISKTMKLIDQFIKDSIVEKPEFKNCDAPDECKNKSWSKYIFEFLQNIYVQTSSRKSLRTRFLDPHKNII